MDNDMPEEQKRDKRDAIPSWNGYIYQGEVAIIAVLEYMLKLKKQPERLKQCYMALEDVEDFSIYEGEELKSIHQVKAKKGTSLSTYNEAIFFLAIAANEHSKTLNKAYLHVEEPYPEDLDVSLALEDFREKQKEKWTYALDSKNSDVLNAKMKELQKCVTIDGKIDRRVSLDKQQILHYINAENWKALTQEDVLEGIRLYELNIEKSSFSQNIVDKIVLYEYKSGERHLDSMQVTSVIENLIWEWWGKNEKYHTKSTCSIYCKVLKEKISEYVHSQRNDLHYNKKIPFSEFHDILEKELPPDGLQRLCEAKSWLANSKSEFCSNCSDLSVKGCDVCDVERMIMELTLFPVTEFQNVAYLLSPDTKKNIDVEPVQLLDKKGLRYCLFKVLKSAYGADLHTYKIIYRKNIICMLTALFLGDEETLGDIIDEISDNSTIEEICKSIVQNHDLASDRMEIDAMIVKHSLQGNDFIDDVESYVPRITQTEQRKDKPPSYMKITNKPKLSLITADCFLERYYGGTQHG
jgi:hypothetical protein